MNRIEYDMIARCLHIIYGQLLTEGAETGLRSVERLISLVRYMVKSELSSTLGEEAQMVQQVFQIYQPDFHMDFNGLDAWTSVVHSTLLYEICRHGMELFHNCCQLQRVALFRAEGHLAYTFTDLGGQTYGGMIYGEKVDLDEKR